MKKCYQYDADGYYLYETSDFGQDLPHNATYVKPSKEKEGFRFKFNGEKWEYEKLPEPEKQEEYTPTKKELRERATYEYQQAQDKLLRSIKLAEVKELAADSLKQALRNLDTPYIEKIKEINAGDATE